jgi:hypothetical protein
VRDDDVNDEIKQLSKYQVRISNTVFNQKKISEFVSCFFAMVGVGCTIVASELNFCYNLDDSLKTDINTLLIISNVSTIFLSKSRA